MKPPREPAASESYRERAAREAASLAPPDERPLVEQFGRLFLAKAPPEFATGRSDEALGQLTLGVFRFLQRAGQAAVAVELADPTDEGWEAPVTVIRTVVSERPFIVDTIREYLHARGLELDRFIYPIMRIVRGAGGGIDHIAPAGEGPPLESIVHCEVERIADPAVREEIRADLGRNLADVVRATDDFDAMSAAIDQTAAYLDLCAERFQERAGEIRELQEFLRWLRDGGFVFLGYRGYDITTLPDGRRALAVEPGSGLGVLRDETASSFARPVPLDELSEGLRARVEGGPLLIINKTNAVATVHRRSRMDYIGVKKLDAAGRVAGEFRFLGLFTSQAYSEDAERIPILREKLRSLLDSAGVLRGSHDYKEMITIFNSMPKEELFLASADQIGRDIQAALRLYHTHEVRVTLRPDPLERGVSVMAVLPKDKFSGEVRKAIEEAFIDRLGGAVLNYHLALGGGDQARLHFYIACPPSRLAYVEPRELEELIRRLTRSWADRLREDLERVVGPDRARTLAARYGPAFSPEYRAAADPASAVQDILALEDMEADERHIDVSFSNQEATPGIAVDEPVTLLKVYLRDESLVLSDFMPLLENAGLRVIAMSPFEIEGPEVARASLYVFAVQDSARAPLDLENRSELLSETILAARAGDLASDSLNGLVLSAGLSWREVDLIRAYAEYAFQLGAVPSRLSLPTALRAYPSAARLLLDLFAVRFDPALPLSIGEREQRCGDLQREFVRSLERVTSLADDRALRRLLTVVEATTRTNYFRLGGAQPTARSGGVPYISLKFSGEILQNIVRSRLLFEVWVQSARMSGVHLRGARVARGGIRHSDRPDDFRSEVLGLVKTQAVKNAVIVPAGSKGGFVVRRQLADPAAMRLEATEQYRTLVRGLLDITDTLVDGEVRHPDGVLAWDSPDPYLVVAADKGTAHLSDVANEIAEEYGFWLGDAFASGGSYGYDHKEVGITARGAWECVKRHFLEMGRDIQREAFSVAGVGDMSGDVFGNGMLLSRQIRLIAAFDHRHIFVDPNPDPEISYVERERLFRAGRTSWADYNSALLSRGGFVVPRGVKRVELTPEALDALGLPADTPALDGESLIRAVLAAPVDLLWNGGIGTYVKSDDETHAEVGDSTNDAVRINASALRAKVIGEGGNLGLTQQGRAQFALAGGRLNTDAIDNAGGVAMSDREVNLKILLKEGILRGTLRQDARNQLLEKLSPAVTELVLADIGSQSLAVSLDELRAAEGVDEFQDMMQRLEREKFLDRQAEGLPGPDDLADRRDQSLSLVRPELAVLLAYSKLSLKRHLLASGIPDEQAVASYLRAYFPADAIKAVGEEALHAHRLRREIVATQLANDLVDLMGATFVHRTARDTGFLPAEVARAWLIASGLCGARSLRQSLTALEGEVHSRVIYRWLLGLTRVLERTTRWVLINVDMHVPVSEFVMRHLEGLGQLRRHFGEIVTGEERRLFEARVAEIQDLTRKADLAQRLITLRFLDQLLEILRVAAETGAAPLAAGRAYYASSEVLGVPWLRETVYQIAGDDRWSQRAMQSLVEDIVRAHRRFTAELLGSGEDDLPIEERLARFEESRGGQMASYLALLEEVRSLDKPRLPALLVASRELLALSRKERI
jgi:glutamate dehydrogenase